MPSFQGMTAKAASLFDASSSTGRSCLVGTERGDTKVPIAVPAITASLRNLAARRPGSLTVAIKVLADRRGSMGIFVAI